MESAQFDYEGTLREFRRACAERGIDPEQGATGYQVVHVVAERHRKEWRAEQWWQRDELWVNCPPYRSETEADAIWSLFAQAYLFMLTLLVEAICSHTAQITAEAESPGRQPQRKRRRAIRRK